MNNYVLGFMFSGGGGYVVLIKKNKPKWQEGLLNGVGGKVEPGEQPFDAMVREFAEETGFKTDREQWTHFGHMTGAEWNVELFATEGPVERCTSMTDEMVRHFATCDVPYYDCIPNLPTLLTAARYALAQREPHRNFKIHIQYE